MSEEKFTVKAQPTKHACTSKCLKFHPESELSTTPWFQWCYNTFCPLQPKASQLMYACKHTHGAHTSKLWSFQHDVPFRQWTPNSWVQTLTPWVKWGALTSPHMLDLMCLQELCAERVIALPQDELENRRVSWIYGAMQRQLERWCH